MPRDASGVYHLPAGNPVQTQTVIASSWANTTLQDIGNELTASLPINGSVAMTGLLSLAQVTPTNPWNAVPKNYVDNAVNIHLPIGSIIMWNNTVGSIPAGWQVCDGTNGTPDMRDRFPMGSGGSVPGAGFQGGSNNMQLTTNQLPYHNHTLHDGGHNHVITDNGHSHPIPRGTASAAGVGANVTTPDYNSTGDIATRTSTTGISLATSGASISIDPAGLGQAWDNRPSWCSMIYIQRMS